MAVTAFVGMLLLSVAAGLANAEDGTSSGVAAQACECPPPPPSVPEVEVVCGSDLGIYPSRCHLECKHRHLPEDKRPTVAKDFGDCGHSRFRQGVYECEKLFEVFPSRNCVEGEVDCWAENFTTMSLNVTDCMCTAYERLYPAGVPNLKIGMCDQIGSENDYHMDILVGVLLKGLALNRHPGQTPQCLINTLKDVALCGRETCTSSTSLCNGKWFEAICSCRSTGS